ncbi:MAG: insulinase family protein [Bacteroidetes bacterium]|nr:insulinase family protein [Bacteroidota bacterium]
MITYNSFKLDNGLTIIVHEDPSTPMAVLNILYNVGARDEEPGQTGFAHLFEHLMFGGSVNIPDFDSPLQRAGGENNAFTNNDITNYYDILPAMNLETAFWLESDRMMSLAFSQRSLDVQKKVVIEEFKERYLNQPYGNVWHKLRELAYKVHPYKWPTIGQNMEQIEKVNLDQVKNFFDRYYCPKNAIMVVAGGVKTEDIKTMSEKWFGEIPAGDELARDIPKEPEQTEKREMTVHENVPLNMIYKSYHMSDRLDFNYYVADFISDILSGSNSSRLYKELVKEKKYFSDIDAYITGSLDAGLVVVEGRIMEGVDPEVADKAIEEELEKLQNTRVTTEELQKIKNKAESFILFSETNNMHKALGLAFGELLGDPDMVNHEIEKYNQISQENILNESQKLFHSNNLSTLYYLSNN